MIAFLSGAWTVLDGIPPEPDGRYRCRLSSTPDAEICAELWPRGAEGMLAASGAGEVWLHVVEGHLDEERYVPITDGEWRFVRRRIDAGQCSTIGPGELYRHIARRASVALTVASPQVGPPIRPFDLADLDALRRARRQALEATEVRGRSRAAQGRSWKP